MIVSKNKLVLVELHYTSIHGKTEESHPFIETQYLLIGIFDPISMLSYNSNEEESDDDNNDDDNDDNDDDNEIILNQKCNYAKNKIMPSVTKKRNVKQQKEEAVGPSFELVEETYEYSDD